MDLCILPLCCSLSFLTVLAGVMTLMDPDIPLSVFSRTRLRGRKARFAGGLLIAAGLGLFVWSFFLSVR